MMTPERQIEAHESEKNAALERRIEELEKALGAEAKRDGVISEG